MFRKFKNATMLIVCLLIVGLGLIFSFPVLAADNLDPGTPTTEKLDPGTPTTQQLERGETPTALANPLGDIKTPTQLIGKIIYAILGLTGAIALVMFIWGGLQWMTAAGSPEKVTKGRDTLMWAVLGLVIIFSSYAVLKAVLGILN